MEECTKSCKTSINEVDVSQTDFGQIKIRMEAFLELLG